MAENCSKSSELSVPDVAMEDRDGITLHLPEGCSDNVSFIYWLYILLAFLDCTVMC